MLVRSGPKVALDPKQHVSVRPTRVASERKARNLIASHAVHSASGRSGKESSERFSSPLVSLSAEGSMILGVNRAALGTPFVGLHRIRLIVVPIVLMLVAPSAFAQELSPPIQSRIARVE